MWNWVLYSIEQYCNEYVQYGILYKNIVIIYWELYSTVFYNNKQMSIVLYW